MDVWMDVRMDVWMNVWMDVQTDGSSDHPNRPPTPTAPGVYLGHQLELLLPVHPRTQLVVDVVVEDAVLGRERPLHVPHT